MDVTLYTRTSKIGSLHGLQSCGYSTEVQTLFSKILLMAQFFYNRKIEGTLPSNPFFFLQSKYYCYKRIFNFICLVICHNKRICQ